MGYTFTLDDVRFLACERGRAALAALADRPLTAATRLADVAAARSLVGDDRAAALLETAVLRRRAAGRLRWADDWLFTEDAVQQATATVVAEHRARRLADRDVHDLTCSVGADLVPLAASARRCLGSDLDPVRLAMAAHNAAVAGVAPLLVRADAVRPVSRNAVLLADPARREAGGRRTWRPEELAPPLPELVAAARGRDLVVKAAPGLDPDLVPWAREVELVSLDGGVREAALWSEGLATPGVRRRASVLGGDGSAWELTDADPDECPVREPGEWLVDPDGAVVRAGLVRHYAARHGLGQLDPRIAYLTGDRPPQGVRAFRVLEHGRYGERTLRARLREREVGRLEILTRGVSVDPDALRKRLRLRGPAEATAVLTRIGDTPVAFLCEAERT
ncbi:THUMP-like domain-containing protein [Actinoalloteichus caeruleus]|uniref:THUMP-like domain-containing protein n=2 Tax=Actinoalloteichus cyanogriseus TaxID=2893586 RepID=A0ABT1JIX0_ACTCY|nr:SAM-dependent methyltransferase [Actinoalloteichus caeruleus]MCP2332101.1 hypothetical protein [Actinoalloteichus caeruleus DSM 43889]